MASHQEPSDDQAVFAGAGPCATTDCSLDHYHSPYHSQFEELSEIASGGFGTVVSAQHKLDQAIYAVKKVSIEKQYLVKIITEVRIMARLDHQNIVNYKQSWIELYNGTKFVQYLPSSSIDSLNTAFKSLRLNTKESDGHEKLLGNSQASSSNEVQPRYVLYIQMKLYEQNLRHWMEKRKDYSTSREIEIIAVQILRGLEYMHKHGIIHHDIKPENIFISSVSGAISLQLGDFGLACPSQQDHTEEIGTKLYTAPEQVGKKCDPKSDVYSFGIVLLELLCLRQTVMEKVFIIQDFKNKNLPAGINQRYPDWVPILKMVLRENSATRPSAESLLDIIKTNKTSQARSRLKLKIQEVLNDADREFAQINYLPQ